MLRPAPLLCLSFAVLTSVQILAQPEPDHQDLFDLDLEQLMQVKVYTVSQQEEDVQESPATVSVITSEQLAHWGVQDLHDVFSFLPGIARSETYIGQSTQIIRGVNPGLFNNKVLYLINGHPSYESLFGSTLLDYIPVHLIERIEVVRSPSSVLYGTNAMSGVVNIITKQGANEDNTVTLRYGSHNHRSIGTSLHGENMSLGINIRNDDGYDFNGTFDEAGNEVDLQYRYDLKNLFADFYGEDWRVNLGFFHREKAFLGINPWQWHNGIFETRVGFINVNKQFQLNDNPLNIWLRYDISDKDIHSGNFPLPNTLAACEAFNIERVFPGPCPNPMLPEDTQSTAFNKVERFSLEAHYKGIYGNNSSFLLGAVVEVQDSEPLKFLFDRDNSLNRFAIQDSQNTDTLALYGVVNHHLNSELNLTLGVRFEDNSDTGFSGLYPRLGMTYRLYEETYIKLLHSEAYRSPMFIEKYVQLPGVLFGDESLDRESIATTELVLDTRTGDASRLQVTLFYSEIEDEILRFPLPPPNPTAEYRNGSEKSVTGIEAEFKTFFAKDFELTFNASYVDGDDQSLDDGEVPFIAQFIANGIGTWFLSDSINITLTSQYVGERDFILGQMGQRGSLESYHLWNFNLNYGHGAHLLTVKLNNIADEDYSHPEPVRRNIAEIPGGPGRTAYLEYQYSF